MKQAACRAIEADVNQYAVDLGALPPARAPSRRRRAGYNRIPVDPERNDVTVCCGRPRR
jgi:hypothetical protein